MCREEYLLYSKLCPECEKIRHLMSIYGREKVVNVLESNLVVGCQKKKAENEKKDTYSNLTMSVRQPAQKKN